MAIQLVIYTISGCLTCKVLIESFDKIAKHPDQTSCGIEIVVRNRGEDEVTCGSDDHIGNVRPRIFPTVIVFQDGVAKLGWEGFAALAPNEIKEALALDAYSQAVNLSRV